MPANVDAMVREGVSAFKAGNKEDARAFLMKAVELDQYNEQAWLWLSAAVDAVEDQRTCLENVLAINPNNERARSGLQLLTQQMAKPGPGVEASAPAQPDFPTSVEWAAPADSDGPARVSVKELSDDDYDAWLTNLNLGSGAPASPVQPPAPAPTEASPFGDLNEDADNLFADGPFSASVEDFFPPTPTPAPAPTPPTPATPAPAPQARAQIQPPAPPVMSPAVEDPDFDTEQDSNPMFGDFETDGADDDELSDMDAAELFSFIPPDIGPTRLPGTNERHPLIVTGGMVLLIMLNIGAAILLITRMTAA